MGTSLRPRIVLSGVNFVEGGPLAIFQDALNCLSKSFRDRFEIIALVHQSNLFDVPDVTYLEFPQVKLSWLRRLRFEYAQCRAISRDLKPYLWLSMHDMTPNVTADIRAVYCHNPAPFYKVGIREMVVDGKFALFGLLYRFLYAINIQKNDFVVVQQQWLREEFTRLFQIKNIIVAHPSMPSRSRGQGLVRTPRSKYRFLYPAFPRSFKNFELILKAAKCLEAGGITNFEVAITIDGSENVYASKLRAEFDSLLSIQWLGRQTRIQVEALYEETDCLLFPSKLETWGMPITEWKRTGKPMLVADLPYAHETVGAYAKVDFVDVFQQSELMERMTDVMRGTHAFAGSLAQKIAPPFATGWEGLFDLLLARSSSSSSRACDELDEERPRAQVTD